jgi:hypothetical protein
MSTAIRRALYGKLAGDTTLNNLLGTPAAGYSKAIYHQQAPDNAPFPFVILSEDVPELPTEAMGDPEALLTDIWLVKAIDRNTSADAAEAIAARIKALLNDATLTISGATHLYLRRQSGIVYPETTDGVQYKHYGGLYRLVYE